MRIDARFMHHVPDGKILLEGGKPAEYWVFLFISSFSRLQKSIESIITIRLCQHSEALGRKIARRHLSRLSDEDRWDYVKALAKDVSYTGDLARPSQVYWRCKRVRDFFSHSQVMPELVITSEYQSFHYYKAKEHAGLSEQLTPNGVRLLERECAWLSHFVYYLSYMGGTKAVQGHAIENERGEVVSARLEILEPPPLPIDVDWKPDNLSRVIKDEPGWVWSNTKTPADLGSDQDE